MACPLPPWSWPARPPPPPSPPCSPSGATCLGGATSVQEAWRASRCSHDYASLPFASRSSPSSRGHSATSRSTTATLHSLCQNVVRASPCQSLAGLHSGFSVSIGSGVIAITVEYALFLPPMCYLPA
eukprot:SM000101S09309  [mRNA]  locus=s101:427704:428251:- [translate_table: standard]